ncbi:p53-induced protein with a death [Elysia marginata]|uniref:P53-induced protein with a death n=1 Tax=Elysia marginata TaxID=1093978 RepID=A0AAV4F9I4_9GAST|nr:p53-induced protein with a death [Elysia marginata]
MDIATYLQEKHHLPNNRENLQHYCKEIPPHHRKHIANIRTQLIEETSKKHGNPIDIMITAQKTLDTYPEHWIHVYTDGSTFKGTINGGYGVRIQYPDKTKEELSESCGSYCSNYEAEAIAIEAAVFQLTSVFSLYPEKKQNIVIFSDSKSVLEALPNESLQNSSLKSLFFTIDSFLKTYGVDLTLQWIPGHCNITGNERADTLAKKGSTAQQQNTTTFLRNNSTEEWLNGWAIGKTGRSLFTYIATPNPKGSINSLEKRDQVIIFRLRTHHAPVNAHLNRIQPMTPPVCHFCDAPYETTTHLLFQCTSLQDLREEYLPLQPDAWNTRYSNSQQLKNTSTFYSQMSNRRAKAQTTAGLIYGAAIGDAIGVACRWMTDDECAFNYGCDNDLVYSKIVQDEHRVLWRQGDWTSNFDQFMVCLESLANWGGVVDELEFARRLQAWAHHGFPELGDSAGVVTSETLRELEEVEGNAVRICKTTHSSEKAVTSCVFVSLLVALILQGQMDKTESEESHEEEDKADKHRVDKQISVAMMIAQSHLSNTAAKEEFSALRKCTSVDSFDAREVSRMSHTFKPVEAALIALHWHGDYRSFICALTKLAGDSSSNCCVGGAILGVLQAHITNSSIDCSWVPISQVGGLGKALRQLNMAWSEIEPAASGTRAQLATGSHFAIQLHLPQVSHHNHDHSMFTY